MTSTPKKPILFGSPNASLKPVPHIVFLVTSNDPDTKLAVIRTLLYFQFHVNPSFTWGYQMLSDSVKIQQRQMLVLSQESLYQFEQDLKVTFTKDLSSILKTIRQVIIQAAWNNGPVGQFQSPLKRQDTAWKGWSGSIKLRNYLFVLGSVPNTLEELNDFLDTTDLDLKNALYAFNHRLLNQEIWMDLMKERIGLGWIETCSSLSLESSVIESWWNVSFKFLGGMFITNNKLKDCDFARLLKQYLPTQVDASTCRSIVGPTSSRAAFLESFESNYFSTWSIRSRKGFPASVSHPSLPPFNVNLLSKSDIFETVIMEDFQAITIQGFIPLTAIEKEKGNQFYCLPSSIGDGMFDFAKFVYGCLKVGQCILCKTVKGYGVILPLLPNLSSFIVISEDMYKSLEDKVSLEQSTDPLYDLNEWNTDVWFSGRFPAYLSSFLQSGKVPSACSEALEDCLLDIWTLSEARFLTSPVKKEKVKRQITPTKSGKSQPKSIVERFSSAPKLFQGFLHLYNCVLFEKYTLFQFLDTIVPEIYGQLVELVPDQDPTPGLLEFYSKELMKPIPKIDEKYSKIDQHLAFLLDNTPTDLDLKTQGLANAWFLKKKQANQKSLTVDPKSILRKAGKELRIKEYQLQLIIWLECLRLSQDTQIPVPLVYLDKAPKKKREQSMDVHLKKCIPLLVDKLVIVTMTSESQSSLWKTYIEPIVKTFYCESLPDIINPIVAKLQPEEEQAEPEPEEVILQPSSPIPKQQKRKKKVKKAPSLIEQMTKRQVVTVSQPKSKSTKRRALQESKEEVLTLDEFLSQSKENVLVPDTPQKKVHPFFHSPTDRFKSPTKRRSVMEFVTPTKRKKVDFTVIFQTPEN